MTSLEFLDDPGALLAAAGGHLALDPVLNTVVTTVAARAVEARAAGRVEEVPYDWWVVARNDHGEVTGVGMRTAPFAPYPLFLLPMPDQAAIELARALHDRDEPVAAVNGALPAAQTCAHELARLRGQRVEVSMHTRLHRLDTVTAPAPASGLMRPAAPGDLELVLAWFEAFADAADEQSGRPKGSHRNLVTDSRTILERIAGQQIWLWERGGVPVHLTAVHPPALGAARIAPVYTPPGHRGRGYAGNTVAAVSQRVLDAGAVPCLYTDQANPTSNKLYAALGYRPVVDMVDLLLC